MCEFICSVNILSGHKAQMEQGGGRQTFYMSAEALSAVCTATLWREEGRQAVTPEWIAVIHFEL